MSDAWHDEPGDRELWRRAAASMPHEPSACPDEADLAAWLDGKAAAAEAEGIEEHLAACPSCLAAARELRDLMRAPPALVGGEVLAAAKGLVPASRAAGRASRLTAAARWAAVAAAGFLVGYAGFLAGRSTQRYRDATEAAIASQASFGLADAPDPAYLDELDELDELLSPGGVR